MSWADLNLLWMVPVGTGPFFVAAVMLCAVWRTYRPHGQDERGWNLDSAYAAVKPRAGQRNADRR